MRTYCGAKCAECPMQGQCAGCVESGGKPFGGRCLLAECVREKGGESCGSCGACAKKETILALVNSLRIPGLPEIETLCPLPGAFVNLPFTFPDGSVAKLLDDTAVYL